MAKIINTVPLTGEDGSKILKNPDCPNPCVVNNKNEVHFCPFYDGKVGMRTIELCTCEDKSVLSCGE